MAHMQSTPWAHSVVHTEEGIAHVKVSGPVRVDARAHLLLRELQRQVGQVLCPREIRRGSEPYRQDIQGNGSPPPCLPTE